MKKLLFSSTLALLGVLLLSVSAVVATVALTTAGGALDTVNNTAVIPFTAAEEAPVYFGVCDPADSGAKFELFYDGNAYSNNSAGDELVQLGTAGVSGAGTYSVTVQLVNGDVVPSGTFYTAIATDRTALEADLLAACGADMLGFVSEPPEGSIRGLVFLDNNRNGIQEIGEPSVSNVFVTVYSSGEWYYEFYTGSDGTYAPVALNESFYALEVTVPSGYIATTPTRIEGIYIGSNGQSLSLNNNFGIAPATADDIAAQQAAADAAAAAAQAQAQTYHAPAATTTQTSYTGGAYTVRSGDTLFRIALNHGVELSALRAANGIYNNTIYPGQQLVIPGAASAPQVAQTQAAPAVVDVASVPAPAVVADAPAVVDANAAPPAAVVAADALPAQAVASGGTHVVAPGENLFRIALNNGVPLNDLAAANSIVNPTMIHVGQVLVIPGQ